MVFNRKIACMIEEDIVCRELAWRDANLIEERKKRDKYKQKLWNCYAKCIYIKPFENVALWWIAYSIERDFSIEQTKWISNLELFALSIELFISEFWLIHFKMKSFINMFYDP